MTTQSCYVDSGMIWTGDPCYLISACEQGMTWDSFCEKLTADAHWDSLPRHSEPLGTGLGLAIGTLYGDGEYQVTFNLKHGEIDSVRVKLA